ncbi:MAG TPA: LysR family transcriptional regulator [Rugosimonospora sp.]|nr:LysR family transcriptional regulator [Rugosimonospora sp.]
MASDSQDFTIDLRKLRLLRELDRRGTVAATATALHLTPSAVSQQLAGLARDLGVPLLERRGRGVTLTGQARLLLEHGDAVQEQLERTRVALAAWSGGSIGQVRVGSLSTGIAALVAPAIARLRPLRPGLAVRAFEYEPAEALALLDAGELDVVVAVDFLGAPTRRDRRYHRVDLITDVMDAVLPTGHPLADPAGVRLADLAGEVWVGAAANDACAHIVNGVCASAGFAPDIRHHCREWSAAAALVAAGAGVALIPRLAQPLHQDGLVVCPVLGEPASRLLFALARAGTEVNPGTAAVLDTIRAVATDRPDATTA